MQIIQIISVLFLIYVGLVKCGSMEINKDFEECVKKGRNYYISIDSYPRLTSTGEPTEVKIKKLCGINQKEFDW